MKKEKFYEASREILLNAVCDMAEIQHGRSVFSCVDSSRAGYSFKSGNRKYEYLFIVKNSGTGCTVTLETSPTDETMTDRAFLLLETLLCDFLHSTKQKQTEDPE